jgi:hypothetical protein
MPHKICDLDEETPLVEPLAGGPRNEKEEVSLAELAFRAKRQACFLTWLRPMEIANATIS